MDTSSLLEKHVKQINTLVQVTCRKKYITGELAQDFQSYVYEKLLENNGKRLTDFQGNYDTSWTGYLSVVITRLAIDFMKKHWGRWENSSAARLLGEAAMKLETLIYRDKYSFSQASQILLEIPDYTTLYRLSLTEISSLQQSLPALTVKKLEPIARITIYCKHDFEAQLNDRLARSERPYIPEILEVSQIELTEEVLETWDLAFQGRLPARRSLSTHYGNQKDPSEPGLDLIETLSDTSGTDPLEQLLTEELKTQLKGFIDHLLSALNDEDWFILSLFLIDNLHISEIARILDKEKPSGHFYTHRKKPVSTKSWKYVNKRISFFMNTLKHHLESLKLDYDARETVSHYILYLMVKKIQKKDG